MKAPVTEVELRLPSKDSKFYTVLLFAYQFDTIRQETYRVCTKVKTYRLRSDAETFASRYGWKPKAN